MAKKMRIPPKRNSLPDKRGAHKNMKKLVKQLKQISY